MHYPLRIRVRRGLAVASLFLVGALSGATHMLENLGRGVVAVPTSPTEVFVSWRLLGTDPGGVEFNVYRASGGGAPVLLNAAPLAGPTHFTDAGANLAVANEYSVRAVIGGVEQPASAAFSLPAGAPVQPYLRVPLQRPAAGPDYSYSPNDSSVGDLDGDGEYELVVKWDPSNAQDNSNSGVTANVFIDAYRLDGTLLWRIDLGRNIRAGAHYTQFLVYDFDGDGRAELVCKTAPNTRDGTGTFIAQPGKFIDTPTAPIDHNADYRNAAGFVLTGPEFFTIFDGLTGAELATTNYVVPRNDDPNSPNVSAWGDNNGNRVDRFLAGVAYLDGRRPSFVFCRGYYTRAVLAAWDWRDGQLTQRWVFDTGHEGTASSFSAWRGQGAHSLTIGDVDGDGRDEITYGAAAVDDDGGGLYSTGLGHGDAEHLSDMDPTRPGLEVWMAHESPGSYGPNGLDFRDARTGAVIFGVDGQGADVGRGVAGDIDPRFLGYEMWGSRGGLMAANGTLITPNRPGQMNFMIWWDGDLLREILDGTTVSKWDWNTNTSSPLLAPPGTASNNGTKANPSLSADILGDWREEVVLRESSNDALRIYTTTIPTSVRLPTLMHDRQYRLAIAWQNVGYNQPPHPSFYLGEGMSPPPAPDIVTSLAALGTPPPAVTSINRHNPFTAGTGATSVVFRVTFNVPVDNVDSTDFVLTTTGGVVGTVGTVAPVTAYVYNVTIGGITGTGTLRLDVAATNDITGPGGAPLAGAFTAGQVYTRATLAWTRATSGGLWSDGANWDGGVIADGVGDVPIFGNFDLTADNTVLFDTPRTLSGLTFGDATPASAASWTISDNGVAANVLTLETMSGVPTVTVNALGTGATATLDLPLGGTDGIAKSGAGTLVLTKAGSLAGQVNVTAGTLRLGAGSAMTASTVSVSAGGGTLEIDGGSFTATSNTTVNGNGGRLIVNAGTAAFAAVATNNSTSGLIRVNGGTFSSGSINIPRSSDGTPSFSFGFVVTGGEATVNGTIGLGTNNSWGSMSVEGGDVHVSGAITVGNQATSGRGGQLRVTGGSLTVANTTDGIILGRRANNVANGTFSGGTTTVERLQLGFAGVTAGTANLTINGGTVYVGAGGISRNAGGAFAANVNLQGGTLGAKASWSSNLPMNLSGAGFNFHAGDATDSPASITLSGVLSGAGGINKTGAGVLTLAGNNTYTGATTVAAGTLQVDGTLAAASAVMVHSGATLAGSGSIHGAVTLGSGASIGGALNTASVTWQDDLTLVSRLGPSGDSDQLAVSGALTRVGTDPVVVQFVPGEGFAPGNVYTIATFGSTNLTAADFMAAGLPEGFFAEFSVGADSVEVRIIGTATITLGDLQQAYDGEPKPVTTETAPAGLDVIVTYDGEETAPTLPGRYEVDAVIADQNYVGNAAGTLEITVSALVRRAPVIGGTIEGSMQVLLAESVTLDGQAAIGGDLLEPGSPSVQQGGNAVLGDVTEAAGAADPTSHTVTLNGSAMLGGLVVRVDPIDLPEVGSLLAPAGTRSVSLSKASQDAGDFATLRDLALGNGVGMVAVPAGAYGNFSANGSSGFVLGVAGAMEPAVYHFQSLAFSGSGGLQIAGPVIVVVGGGFSTNVSLGDATHPEWLELRLASGGLTLDGNATVHAVVLAPAGTVALNGNAELHGRVSADRIVIGRNAALVDPAQPE